MSAPLTVLFLYTGNSCRSQLAEGWARELRRGVVEPYSAGLEPGKLDPRAVQVMAEAGIGCGVHYKPLFELTFYRELGYAPQYFPNAAYAGERVVTLPLYPQLRLTEVDRVCNCVRDIVARFKR